MVMLGEGLIASVALFLLDGGLVWLPSESKVLMAFLDWFCQMVAYFTRRFGVGWGYTSRFHVLTILNIFNRLPL
jgi:hypothetical protein